MNIKLIQPVALILLITAIVSGFKTDSKPKDEAVLKFPNRLFSDSLNLAKFKGKVVVINFWASWSKASRAENKNVVRVYEKYRQISRLAFVSVSLDTDDKSWKIAIEEDEMAWPDHICDYKKYDSPIAKQFGVTTLPRLVIVDKEGKIHLTGSKMSEVESAIDALMK